ncbi:MAG: SDR family oxidoreductase [Betaproteobacteria bacterium]|nr:SDR family oxidoreductase [Betaproteobacteria bacterium]MDE2211201.1 SDR family oxidoreductase [Betaproteobacteria bacterium]MDE2624192.1 SDR family oxidoreductase [Betaproteobacteria bacterium]
MSTSSPAAGIALVTGAARRLGKSMALALAAAGWDLAIHCHRSHEEALETADEVKRLGRRVLVLQADLSSPEETGKLLPECRARLGLPHCLVNNASLFEFDDGNNFQPELLQRHMAVNLSAPLLLSRALFHAHREACPDGPNSSPGVIINLLDQKLINLNPDFLSYTLSKAALETATYALARTYAPWLRVVGLAPGITLPSGAQSEAEFVRAHHQTPLGHASFPKDIAQAAVYLASASAVTGTTLYVDGGQHLQPSRRDIMFQP